MKKSIAVIFGGQSSEHEVSCLSAANVLNGLDTNKYDVHKIGITKDGRWLYIDDVEALYDGSWCEGNVTAVISPDRKDAGFGKFPEGTGKLFRLMLYFRFCMVNMVRTAAYRACLNYPVFRMSAVT